MRKGIGPHGLGAPKSPAKQTRMKKLTEDPRKNSPDNTDTIAQAHYNDDPRTSMADIAKESIKRHGNFGIDLNSEAYKKASDRPRNFKAKREQYGLKK